MNMKRDLVIGITGPAKSGKTSLSVAIIAALKAYGFSHISISGQPQEDANLELVDVVSRLQSIKDKPINVVIFQPSDAS